MTKIALVTGAGGNLGKATVTRFVNDGYQVIGTVSPGKNAGYEMKNVRFYEVDLSNESKSEALVEQIKHEYGQIDAALLLAGTFAMGNITKTDGAALKKMFTINFETAYFIARPVFEVMKNQPNGGRIVFVGSRPSLDSKIGKDMLAYSLSKSLLFKLSEYINAEGSEHNVVSSVIVPSTIDTPENRNAMPKADFNKWVTPESIAKNLSFLCGPDGQTLREPILKVYGKA